MPLTFEMRYMVKAFIGKKAEARNPIEEPLTINIKAITGKSD